MPDPTVVLLGNLSVETTAVDGLVREFGWSIATAAGLDQLRELGSIHDVIAVLFDSSGLGLTIRQALEAARDAAPRASLIACHRFSDTVNWPELAEAGAFHALAMPFNLSEVRQSLGFVWSARLSRSADVLPMRSVERRGEFPSKTAQLRDAS